MSDPVCMWCGEPVTETDDKAPIAGGTWHRECGIRAVVGSVAHLERKCSCYRPGEGKEESCEPPGAWTPPAPEGDPPGMTRREAARAAAELAAKLRGAS